MRPLLAALTAVLVMSGAACGSTANNVTYGGGDGGGGDGSGRDAHSDGNLRLGGDSGSGHVTGLTITPASSTLTVTDPTAPKSTTLVANAQSGSKVSSPVSAAWTLDRLDIASIGSGSGVLTPTGTTFGIVHVTAKADGLTASATVTVSAKYSQNPGMLSATAQSSLDNATAADPAVTTFAYPYDQTVFPEGLLPPEEMWNGGAMGDNYSLHYVAPNFDLTVYLTADPPSQFTLPVATWNSLTTSAAGASVAVTLNRLTGTTAYKSASQTWSLTTANLGGTIYYWSISEGQIQKIDLKTGARSLVFASGPNTALGTPAPIDDSMATSPPWEDNGAGLRCVACHAVSKDGSTLTSVFSRFMPGSTGPLGFINVGSAAITAIGDYQDDTCFDALTPDGSQAVLNGSGKTMQLLTSATGAPVASALDALTNVCDPAFSPDGTKFALATNCDPGFGYPIEYRQSNLSFYSFSNTAPFFTNPLTVITSTGIGDAIAFPSFSPDSNFIFFQQGSYSRAKYTDSTTMAIEHGVDDLYVAPTTAGATAIPLASANNPGGVLPADSQHLNYAPTVNPISAGGYIWVVFTSPRDYGNAMVSPQMAAPMDATYSNKKQLWVTAVDANIGTTDPSHPPFWLPGQDLTTPNMFGYWALSPCLPTIGDAGPSSCAAGFECCSGFCRDDGAGPVCVASAPGCHQVGEKCTTTSDCCSQSGVSCLGGICQDTVPK